MDDTLDCRILGADEGDVLSRVADGVFDGPVRPELANAFLGDDRHHLAVAIDGRIVVGMASALHYVHPDKPAELWINEVGVAPSHRRRGIARRLLEALFARGRSLGCREAWVLTKRDNRAARSLYAALGGDEEEQPVYVTFTLS